jgi:hypothetical protein
MGDRLCAICTAESEISINQGQALRRERLALFFCCVEDETRDSSWRRAFHLRVQLRRSWSLWRLRKCFDQEPAKPCVGARTMPIGGVHAFSLPSFCDNEGHGDRRRLSKRTLNLSRRACELASRRAVRSAKITAPLPS